MAVEVPSAGEIRQLAVQVMETARRVRVEHELDPQAMANRGAGAAAQREAVADHGYSWVPEFFDSYLGPDPAGFDGPIAVMQEAERKLYDRDSHTLPINGFLQDLGDYLQSEHWDGNAAKNFRTNFLYRLEEVTKEQSVVAFTLKHALISDRELFVRVRQNLKDTAEKTITALEAIEVACKPDEIAVALSVVSAVAATGAAVATLGSAAPAAIAGWTFVAGATSGAAGVVGTIDDPAAPRRDLKSETVDGVLQNMAEVIQEIWQEVDRQEQDIVGVLQNDLDLMTSGAIVTFPDGERRSATEFFLVPRPDELIEQAGRATNQNLPDADRDDARDYLLENFAPY